MKFTYTLEEDDLKEYFQEALKHDKQIRSFKWKLRIAGLIGGAVFILFNTLNTKWLLIAAALVVFWELVVQLFLFPGYIKRISAPMMESARGTMKEMTVEVTDKKQRLTARTR
ncbi:MAG: hypothetical protein IJI05_00825 [Erysipelotrichaceae bacterium]|nr:hypothetical protein [Erysipelotrichaceae bacterium]